MMPCLHGYVRRVNTVERFSHELDHRAG